LKAGKLTYVANNQETELNIDGGFVEVNNNSVTICLEAVS
jgi:F0F1-type ATP synthase epsilon subunit